MPHPKCLEFCPHITVPTECLVLETQIPSSSDRERVADTIDELTAGVARVALSDCEGPVVEVRTVEKNGYWESTTPVRRRVYVCGDDGYVQPAAFYYRTDKMPK